MSPADNDRAPIALATVGDAFAGSTVTVTPSVPVAPSLSVTVSRNVSAVSPGTSGAVNVGRSAAESLSVTGGPDSCSHAYPVIEPPGSELPDPFMVTRVPPVTRWSSPAFAVGLLFTVTVTVSASFNRPSLTVSLNVMAVSPSTLGAVNVGRTAAELLSVTDGPDSCSQAYVRGSPSGSELSEPSSVTVVRSFTRWSSPASAVGARFGTVTLIVLLWLALDGSVAVTVTSAVPGDSPVIVTPLEPVVTLATLAFVVVAVYVSGSQSGSVHATSVFSWVNTDWAPIPLQSGRRFGTVTLIVLLWLALDGSVAVTVTSAVPGDSPVIVTPLELVVTLATLAFVVVAVYVSGSQSASVHATSVFSWVNTDWAPIPLQSGRRFGTVTLIVLLWLALDGSVAVTVTSAVPGDSPAIVTPLEPVVTLATLAFVVVAVYVSGSQSGSVHATSALSWVNTDWAPIPLQSGRRFGTVTLIVLLWLALDGSVAVTVTSAVPGDSPAIVTPLEPVVTLATLASVVVAVYVSGSQSGSVHATSVLSCVYTDWAPIPLQSGRRFGTVTLIVVVSAAPC